MQVNVVHGTQTTQVVVVGENKVGPSVDTQDPLHKFRMKTIWLENGSGSRIPFCGAKVGEKFHVVGSVSKESIEVYRDQMWKEDLEKEDSTGLTRFRIGAVLLLICGMQSVFLPDFTSQFWSMIVGYGVSLCGMGVGAVYRRVKSFREEKK